MCADMTCQSDESEKHIVTEDINISIGIDHDIPQN